MRVNRASQVDGKCVHLWAQNDEGGLTMNATATATATATLR
jgi:hypothetical protein